MMVANVIALVLTDLDEKKAPEAYMGYALYDADSNLYEKGKIILGKRARNEHEELKTRITCPPWRIRTTGWVYEDFPYQRDIRKHLVRSVYNPNKDSCNLSGDTWRLSRERSDSGQVTFGGYVGDDGTGKSINWNLSAIKPNSF